MVSPVEKILYPSSGTGGVSWLCCKRKKSNFCTELVCYPREASLSC